MAVGGCVVALVAFDGWTDLGALKTLRTGRPTPCPHALSEPRQKTQSITGKNSNASDKDMHAPLLLRSFTSWLASANAD